MANAEHLARLNAGADTWNDWRRYYPDQVPDLREANLRHANLQGMNLSYANFSGADCTGVNFAGADVSHADFANAHLEDAILKWTDSRGTVFTNATFTHDPALSLHLVTSLLARGAIARPPNPAP